MRKLKQELRAFLDTQGRRFDMKADRLCEGASNLTRYDNRTTASAWPKLLNGVPAFCVVKYQEPSFLYFRSAAIS